VVGVIANLTENIRYVFSSLVAMICVAVPLLWDVDVEKGRINARNYVGRELT